MNSIIQLSIVFIIIVLIIWLVVLFHNWYFKCAMKYCRITLNDKNKDINKIEKIIFNIANYIIIIVACFFIGMIAIGPFAMMWIGYHSK